MQRQGQFLTILLVLQIALVAILFFTKTDSGAYGSDEKLLDLKFDSVDKIILQGVENKTLVLQKKKGGWTLPGYFQFPASREKLDRVFGKLFDVTVGWPVATTQSAENRFKVATDEFEVKLVFSSAQTAQTLFLGTSPGFKKIHARVDGNNTIYGIDFSAYQASTKPIDWVNQSILHVPREDISAIEIGGLIVKRVEGKFVVDGLAEGEQMVEPEIQLLLTQVSSLGFQDVLGEKNNPAYSLDSSVLELTLVDKAGRRLRYRYAKLKDSDDYVLKPSDSNYYFKVAKYNVESLLGFDRKKLVKSGVPTQKSEEDPPAMATESKAE